MLYYYWLSTKITWKRIASLSWQFSNFCNCVISLAFFTFNHSYLFIRGFYRWVLLWFFLNTLSGFLSSMDDGNLRADIDRCLSVKPTFNIPQYQYLHINIDLSVFQDSSGEDLLILAIVGKFCAKVLWGTKYKLLWICITWFHSGMTISAALWTGLPCCYLMISLWNCF